MKDESLEVEKRKLIAKIRKSDLIDLNQLGKILEEIVRLI